MQMARDLGHSLADATNSLGSQLVTKLTGQSSAVATADLQTSQLNPNPNTSTNTNTNTNTGTNTNTSTNSTSTQTPEPQQAANNTAAATAQPEQTSRQLYDSQVHFLQTPVSVHHYQLLLLCTPCSQESSGTALKLLQQASQLTYMLCGIQTGVSALQRQLQVINAQRMTVCVRAQVDQLADMVSAVFMVHSASQLDVFSHLNTSHAFTAAELAVDIFWKQVSLLRLPLVTPTVTKAHIERASNIQKAVHLC